MVLEGIINKSRLPILPLVFPLAAVDLKEKRLVYLDGANGLKVVPVTSIPKAYRIMYLDTDTNNTGGSVGDKKAQCYKSGIRAICRTSDALVVGDHVQAATGTGNEGEIKKLADAASGGAEAHQQSDLGIYVGKPDEVAGTLTGNTPSNAAANDDVVVDFR